MKTNNKLQGVKCNRCQSVCESYEQVDTFGELTGGVRCVKGHDFPAYKVTAAGVAIREELGRQRELIKMSRYMSRQKQSAFTVDRTRATERLNELRRQLGQETTKL